MYKPTRSSPGCLCKQWGTRQEDRWGALAIIPIAEKNLPRHQRKTWAACYKSLNWQNRCRCSSWTALLAFKCGELQPLTRPWPGTSTTTQFPKAAAIPFICFSHSYHLNYGWLLPWPADVWMQVDHTADKMPLLCWPRHSTVNRQTVIYQKGRSE